MLTHPSKTLIGDELLCEGCEDRNKTDLDDVETCRHCSLSRVSFTVHCLQKSYFSQ